MSTFPSILTSYTNPTPTNPLNVPSHSGIEIAQNSGLIQLEATVGLSGAASTLGTLYGDLHSPASNGGGHVQSANTGGTGQTSYNKGDILVASSSSVLAKLAVGTDGTVLIADSTQTAGLRYSPATSVLGTIKTRNGVTSVASGTQTIPHTLGGIPKKVELSSKQYINSNPNFFLYYSDGMYDGVHNNCLYGGFNNNAGGVAWNSPQPTASSVFGISIAGQTGIITTDATNITIAWTGSAGSGSPLMWGVE